MLTHDIFCLKVLIKMKVSDLDYEKLTEEEKLSIVMAYIEDFSKGDFDEKKKADIIVVLGCSPYPLKARTLKTMELVKKGYAKLILFSGGLGWKGLFEKKDPTTGKIVINEEKRRSLIQAIKDNIDAELLGDNPTPRDLAVHEAFMAELKARGLDDEVMTYEESQDNKKLRMTEVDFMKLIMLSNGGLQGVRFLHEPFSRTTKENMEYTKEVLRNAVKFGEIPKVKKMLIVTSAFHCKRAMLTFKKQFSDIEIEVCPATRDLEDRGVTLGEGMLQNDYYREQIHRESQAIINYSRNGSIYDADLEDIVPIDVAKKIEKRQANFEH